MFNDRPKLNQRMWFAQDIGAAQQQCQIVAVHGILGSMLEQLRTHLIQRIRLRLTDIQRHTLLKTANPDVDALHNVISDHRATITLDAADAERLDSLMGYEFQLNALLQHMDYDYLFLIEECLLQIQENLPSSRMAKNGQTVFLIAHILVFAYGLKYWASASAALLGTGTTGIGPIMLFLPFFIASAIVVVLFQHFVWKNLNAVTRGFLGNGFGFSYIPTLAMLLVIL